MTGFPLASYRGGSTYAPPYETLVIAAFILAMTVACVFIARYLRRRYRRPNPVANQWQALAVMGELCPHGWQAQITLGARAEADDGDPADASLIELEWKQFDPPSDEVAVSRRVWAPTIGLALQTMVADRHTDVTLEEIERGTGENGDVRSRE